MCVKGCRNDNSFLLEYLWKTHSIFSKTEIVNIILATGTQTRLIACFAIARSIIWSIVQENTNIYTKMDKK